LTKKMVESAVVATFEERTLMIAGGLNVVVMLHREVYVRPPRVVVKLEGVAAVEFVKTYGANVATFALLLSVMLTTDPRTMPYTGTASKRLKLELMAGVEDGVLEVMTPRVAVLYTSWVTGLIKTLLFTSSYDKFTIPNFARPSALTVLLNG